jgi:UDP-N-acetylmuramoyl-L-alanyl-D-glutamate--2,6-diaminopimelate ligase
MQNSPAVPVTSRPVQAAAPWAEGLFTVGVTGTNGKTSTTLLVAEVLRSSGQRVVVETTLGIGTRTDEYRPREGTDFYQRMQAAASDGISRLAIEVTSEALASGWARRWRFDLGVFTNLSQDHLDAHGSFEHYLASKAQLFVHLAPGAHAILNAADPAALLIDRVLPADVSRCWYAAPARGPALTKPDLAVESLRLTLDGTELRLAPSPLAEQLGGRLATRLIGSVFAENALAAASVGLRMGIDPETVRAGVLALPRVPGRFELVCRSPVVAVDYAHTPDALARTCDAGRALAEALGDSRVIVVFGAGGKRDKTKRRPMGEAVGARADFAIVTSDNPRNEDPKAIARPLENGCRRGGRAHVTVELNRRNAIARALERARPSDVILICGKGHERGQTIGEETLPFDDADVARELLSAATGKAGEG